MHLAHRTSQIKPSETLAITAKAKALRASGLSIINFAGGEPDADTPQHIKDAAIRAIAAGKTKYTSSSGLPELRQAVCERLSADRGLAYEPEQVIVSNGAKHSLWNALQVICDVGDEVLIPAPYWVSYPPLVHLTGATPRIIPTTEGEGFKLTPQRLQEHLTPQTRALILNAPSNPTGAVYTTEELAALADVIRSHDAMYIISDEIYEHLVYPPLAHASIATLDAALMQRTILISGVSKSFAMTGWRIGYLAAPEPVAEAVNRIQSHSTSNPSSISQYAALAALTGPQEPVLGPMRDTFMARRNLMVQGLRQIPGLTCGMPEGAFYVFCNTSGLQQGSVAISAQWLEEAHVATVPGNGFGSDAHVRLSYATDDASIREGIQRLAQWVEQHVCATS